MTPLELVEFVRRHSLAVEASVGPGGAPQAAVVGVVVTSALELFFDTLDSTRKCKNLRIDPRVAFVIGWDEACTLQYEGVVDEPRGTELEALQRLYFAQFPEGPARRSWPGITYFRARPTWIRFSDFRGESPRIVELEGPALRT